VRALAVDLDGALGDTRPLWRAWLEDAARRLRVELAVPEDRAEAAAVLDGLIGNWRPLLERFAEDHAPVYLRPNAEASASLRRLQAAGVRLGAFTDAPEELARVALAHFGAARRLETIEAGPDALERLRERLGADVTIVRTPAELGGVAK
jgi:phosphoglycolate phosphatase-like HAD superfamily hydrolase